MPKYYDEDGKEVKLVEVQKVNEPDGLQSCSSVLSGCGCLMTLFITLPIVFILLFLF